MSILITKMEYAIRLILPLNITSTLTYLTLTETKLKFRLPDGNPLSNMVISTDYVNGDNVLAFTEPTSNIIIIRVFQFNFT